jgi:hypothetical protein
MRVRPRFPRRAGLVALVCAAALVLSGCFRAAYDTYTVTGGHLYTIKQRYSVMLWWQWAREPCNKDLNGNGVPGGEQDRGWCALRLIRLLACSNLSGVVQNLCNAAAADQEWDDFNPAMRNVAVQGSECLAVDINPFVDNRYNWTNRPLDGGACQSGF